MNSESPCIKECNLNDEKMCTSCGRHIEEIRNWKNFSVEDKKSINIKAGLRLKGDVRGLVKLLLA